MTGQQGAWMTMPCDYGTAAFSGVVFGLLAEASSAEVLSSVDGNDIEK